MRMAFPGSSRPGEAFFRTNASLAATPSTAPKQGDMAVSFNVWLANAFDDHFEDVEPVYTGTFEELHHSTSLVAGPDRRHVVRCRPLCSVSVDSTFANGNVVYNWEKGRIHPCRSDEPFLLVGSTKWNTKILVRDPDVT